jgi:hypothetical protein
MIEMAASPIAAASPRPSFRVLAVRFALRELPEGIAVVALWSDAVLDRSHDRRRAGKLPHGSEARGTQVTDAQAGLHQQSNVVSRSH